ncbi:MAG: hypothetical protein ACR2IE_05010 [Candidatus Sumerlaeaceae bacterium]
MPSSRTVHKTPKKANNVDALKPKPWSGPERPADTKSTKGAGKKKKKKK